MKKLSKLVCSVSLCLLTGFVGSFSTMNSVTSWYADLSRPSSTPPNWTFGVVWPILYIMMGISFFMIWNRGLDKRKVKIVLGLFLLQLVLNGLWTPIFFGLHMIAFALIEIVLLWVAILLTILVFWRISKSATFFLFPYILWVSFAAVLNTALWYLNR
jgi:translocator protein